ncbi:LysE family translocator [Methylovirgula sp. 4M-Z18]|uniref:LysE family translocator n=1 Tax=Methylovirgula sp. 4M-Z18 TaxID=2293567 RepID=UPI000E2E4327|nr:LysE family translocator [Methylovirgula sp. 4M-Z18]RFB75052.1 LysE family translocator [Methylovirgula sp. 4M-Z18]
MPLSLFLPLTLFAFVGSATPGPNNLLLLTSGLNFGLSRTMPLLLGISLGFTLMVALVGFGLGPVFARFPVLYVILKYAGAAYLLWLARKIAGSGPLNDGAAAGNPMSFLQGAAFQWVNPKAWMMAVTACATYTLADTYALTMGVVTLVFLIVTVPATTLWAAFGTAMRGWLSDPKRLKVFNFVMAALLVASLIPVFVWE